MAPFHISFGTSFLSLVLLDIKLRIADVPKMGKLFQNAVCLFKSQCC